MKFLDNFREVFFETPVKNCFWANWKRPSDGVLEKKIKYADQIHGPALFT